jgi:uncharacterized protein (DUF488 family)
VLVPADVSLWTIGYPTRIWEEFLGLLRENRIERLVDVRHFPTSARVPWTNRDKLAAHLHEVGVAYKHLENLGGYRRPKPHSKNTAWRNEGFRGYADCMETASLATALDRIIAETRESRTAILCADAAHWRCHGGLLSDALLVRGVHLIHIL